MDLSYFAVERQLKFSCHFIGKLTMLARVKMMKVAVVFDFSGTLAFEGADFSLMLFPDVLWLLEKLKEEGHELYLWTALGRTSAIHALEKLGIGHFFNAIRTPSDCRGKPHPEGLHQLFPSRDPKEVVVIGDSPGDMSGAQAFGAYAIGVTWNNSRRTELLKQAGAQVITDDPKVCYQLIKDYQEGIYV